MKGICSILLTWTIFLSVGVGQEEKLSPDMGSLVEAERAFARTSVEKGIRESFIMFFADDGINFQPHPVKTKETLLKQPAPATRPPIVLDWQPVYADISRAGDLGYTTGPYSLTDHSPQNRPPRYGTYFSIWKKQADRTWKVVVDAGIKTPDHSGQAVTFKAASQSPSRRGTSKINLQIERAALMNLDREFLRASQSREVSAAFLDYLGGEPRLHRDGRFPLIGRDSIQAFLSANKMEFTWEPIQSDIAQSGDLGYSYGSYDLTYSDTKVTEKGYYVRIWKRDAKGKWKLELDTLSPIP